MMYSAGGDVAAGSGVAGIAATTAAGSWASVAVGNAGGADVAELGVATL